MTRWQKIFLKAPRDSEKSVKQMLRGVLFLNEFKDLNRQAISVSVASIELKLAASFLHRASKSNPTHTRCGHPCFCPLANQ